MLLHQNDWIVIPFHFRLDLLLSLLKSISSYSILVIDDSDALLDGVELGLNVQVLKNNREPSFANSVNTGLEHLAGLGVQKVLVLNDDARISEQDCQSLFLTWKPKTLISPIIQQGKEHFYGVRVQNWGRVSILKESSVPDALLGTCLLLPTELRFDSSFPHGFEDIELSIRARKAGYHLEILDTCYCQHIGEGTLSRRHRKGQRYSTYGQLRLYSSKRKAPLIGLLSLLQIVRERGDSERYLGFVQGVGDWLFKDCFSLATRMASSKEGSNKAR